MAGAKRGLPVDRGAVLLSNLERTRVVGGRRRGPALSALSVG